MIIENMSYNKNIENTLKTLIYDDNTLIDTIDTLSVLIDKIAIDKRLEGLKEQANTFRNSAIRLEIEARNIEDITR